MAEVAQEVLASDGDVHPTRSGFSLPSIMNYEFLVVVRGPKIRGQVIQLSGINGEFSA
jgi:hypothetical protein